MKQANTLKVIITLRQFLNFSILWLSFFGCQFLPRDDWSMSLVMDSKLAWSPISPFSNLLPLFCFLCVHKKREYLFQCHLFYIWYGWNSNILHMIIRVGLIGNFNYYNNWQNKCLSIYLFIIADCWSNPSLSLFVHTFG